MFHLSVFGVCGVCAALLGGAVGLSAASHASQPPESGVDAGVTMMARLTTPSLEYSSWAFAPESADEAVRQAEEEARRREQEAIDSSFVKGWVFSIEAGLNGSSGNSDLINFRAGLGARREASDMVTALRAAYAYGKSGGVNDKSRADVDIRNDWIFGDSRWGLFALGKFEFDNFQSWNYRLSLFAGPSYRLLDTQPITLSLRAGAGAKKELLSPNQAWEPELLGGLDAEWRLNERVKLVGLYEIYPSLKRLSTFRWLARGALEVLVDPSLNLVLKAGVENRYDTAASAFGRRRSDVDFFVLMSLGF
jgi:putative salt-induced outer membrane protein YdiY